MGLMPRALGAGEFQGPINLWRNQQPAEQGWAYVESGGRRAHSWTGSQRPCWAPTVTGGRFQTLPGQRLNRDNPWDVSISTRPQPAVRKQCRPFGFHRGGPEWRSPTVSDPTRCPYPSNAVPLRCLGSTAPHSAVLTSRRLFGHDDMHSSRKDLCDCKGLEDVRGGAEDSHASSCRDLGSQASDSDGNSGGFASGPGEDGRQPQATG